MKNEIKGGGSHELSTDINVITAEIKVEMARVGESIYRIGERLQKVRDNPKAYGFKDYRDWERWCSDEFSMTRQHANRFIRIVEELGTSMFRDSHLGVAALYQIATMPEESRTETHTIPSTGAEKTVDEMTVRELREVKAELKKTQEERDAERRQREQAEAQAETAHRSEAILRAQLEVVEEREPKDIEKRIEYVEIPDTESRRKIERYEELFGDVSLYEGQTTRVTNGDAITYTVFEFTQDVRKFIEKYGHLTHFVAEFSTMIDEGKDEYREAINDMYRFMKAIDQSMDAGKTTIING